MQKYYLIPWPESKAFRNAPMCIQASGMSYFVPCEVYDNNQSENKDQT